MLNGAKLMQIEKHDYYDENAIFYLSVQSVVEFGLRKLETFLKQLMEDKPDLTPTVIDNIISRCSNGNTHDLPIKSDDYKILQKYPELLDRSIGTILSFMNYPKYQHEPFDEPIDIRNLDLLRPYVLFPYIQATSLTAIMPRKDAAKYYQDYVDSRTRKKRDPKKYDSDLNAFMDRAKIFYATLRAHNVIFGVLAEGRIVMKVTKCMAADIMKEKNDPEFGYPVICYSDFPATENANPNFRLTRTGTLAQGAPYCDFCYHDTREVTTTDHPPKEFWENLK